MKFEKINTQVLVYWLGTNHLLSSLIKGRVWDHMWRGVKLCLNYGEASGIFQFKCRTFWNTCRWYLMMLRLSVSWTVFDVVDQRVVGKSWKINSKVRGDRWRPAKNPPMAKLVFLWFQMSEKCSNVYLFVDQCFYSTPTEQSSPFT